MFQPKSEDEFNNFLSENSGKIICLYFYADWAQPCILIDQLLGAQEEASDAILYIKIDVKILPELPGIFNVSSVPTIIFIKENTVLNVIVGAKPEEIVKASSTYSDPNFIVADPNAELNNRLKKLINQHDFMIFIKGTPSAPRCGFTSTLLRKLSELKIEYDFFDILSDNDVRQGLKEYSKWPTYPQIYIKGELLGGLDIFTEMVESGQLTEILQN